MRDYNAIVENIIDIRNEGKEKLNTDIERIIEDIITKFKDNSINSITLTLDRKEGKILLEGKKVMLKYQYADEVYDEVSRILKSDIPQLENFQKYFYVRKNNNNIRISLK